MKAQSHSQAVPYFLLLTATVLTLLCSACGGGDELSKKKKELADLRVSQTETAAKIKTLEKEIAKLDPTQANEEKPRPVKAITLATTVFKHFVQVQGAIISDQNVMVNAKTPGIVTDVYVREGDQVKKGQVLAMQDVSVIQQSISELKTGMELAEDVYNRRKALWEQKVGTEIEYIQAKNNVESLKKKLATVQAQLALSKITSPIDGVVDAVNIKEGEVASPGFGIIRVVNLSKVKVEAKVADAYLGAVKAGDNIEIRLPDLGKTISGSLSFVGKTVDAMSRTFPVEAQIAQSADLRPNMTAIIQINDRTAANAIVIDENLVQNTEEGTTVFVVGSDKGKPAAEMRKVKLGQAFNGQVEIVEGLKAGEQIISFGFNELVNKTPITIEAPAAQ